MKATVLVDNIAYEKIPGEWGLSIYIEYGKHQILLDTGASGLFIKNAEKLGIDIKKIDFAVLSHAHFDHANGMEDFFFTNLKAKFYLREGSAENQYIRKWFFSKYIGIKKKTLKTFAKSHCLCGR
jgi:7,8-dihydropterin-6-yl-methyl-4-(beta-D-ribofuranosyl)aminobenzene 5'-phosphate synthase